MNNRRKIISIQHLRAVAAISVLGAQTFWSFNVLYD